MLKIYQKYIIKKFLLKFIFITIIFFSLSLIMGVLEEISFFSKVTENFFLPYLLTILNAPSTLFEIFPFIFFLTTQFFFFELFEKDEMNLIKKSGLKNTTIIKNIFFLSILIGILNVVIFYNFSASLKFKYSNLKNDLSGDNKYLAMVTESGLWIKDEINEKKLIIKAKQFKDDYIYDVVINEFDNNFKLKKIIKTNKIDIQSNEWIIFDAEVTSDTLTIKNTSEIIFTSNFDSSKIKNIFSNIYSYDLFRILSLKKDFNNLGYATEELVIHLYKLLSTPLFYGLLSVLASIIMLNFPKNNSIIYQLILGIFFSVVIYYVIFIFNSLGVNGKIPKYFAIAFPQIIITLISMIGLLNINDK